MPIPLNHSQDFPILQYVDYTLIIMEAKHDQLAALKDILNLFSLSIGLKVNFSKSMLVPINMEPERSLVTGSVLWLHSRLTSIHLPGIPPQLEQAKG